MPTLRHPPQAASTSRAHPLPTSPSGSLLTDGPCHSHPYLIDVPDRRQVSPCPSDKPPLAPPLRRANPSLADRLSRPAPPEPHRHTSPSHAGANLSSPTVHPCAAHSVPARQPAS